VRSKCSTPDLVQVDASAERFPALVAEAQERRCPHHAARDRAGVPFTRPADGGDEEPSARRVTTRQKPGFTDGRNIRCRKPEIGRTRKHKPATDPDAHRCCRPGTARFEPAVQRQRRHEFYSPIALELGLSSSAPLSADVRDSHYAAGDGVVKVAISLPPFLYLRWMAFCSGVVSASEFLSF